MNWKWRESCNQLKTILRLIYGVQNNNVAYIDFCNYFSPFNSIQNALLYLHFNSGFFQAHTLLTKRNAFQMVHTTKTNVPSSCISVTFIQNKEICVLFMHWILQQGLCYITGPFILYWIHVAFMNSVRCWIVSVMQSSGTTIMDKVFILGRTWW